MLIRPKLVVGMACLATSAALLFSGCSGKSPRDINYGTDVGVGFVPPEAGVLSSTDSAGEANSSEAGGDGGTSLDALLEVSVEVPSDLDANQADGDAQSIEDGPSTDVDSSLDEGS